MPRKHATFEQLFRRAGLRESPRVYKAHATVFAQGDRCDSVFHIMTGKVQLTVLSKQGREAVIAVLNSGAFFGEESLNGSRVRAGSARTLTEATIVRIGKSAMVAALGKSHALSESFVQYLLSRNMRIQEDLVDQLFNSSEKRLARLLLLLAHFGKDGTSESVLPRVSQDTLAKMVGTTRARVNFFMNKFRKLGFIEYNGGMQIHSSLINVIVHE